MKIGLICVRHFGLVPSTQYALYMCCSLLVFSFLLLLSFNFIIVLQDMSNCGPFIYENVEPQVVKGPTQDQTVGKQQSWNLDPDLSNVIFSHHLVLFCLVSRANPFMHHHLFIHSLTMGQMVGIHSQNSFGPIRNSDHQLYIFYLKMFTCLILKWENS